MFARIIMNQIQLAPQKIGPWKPIQCPDTKRSGYCAMGCPQVRTTHSTVSLCQSVGKGRSFSRVPPDEYNRG